ncbi:MAG: hypothetical protein QM767_29640 [Anaeromyxobacter sp.]
MATVSIVVPTLIPNLFAFSNFGAWKEPLQVVDTGGVGGTGVVHLRGAVGISPLFQPPPHPTNGPYAIFTLPAGMRPATDRFVTYQRAVLPGGQLNSTPAMLVIRANGEVQLREESPCPDYAWYFDGVSFLAEDKVLSVRPRPVFGKARKPAAKGKAAVTARARVSARKPSGKRR